MKSRSSFFITALFFLSTTSAFSAQVCVVTFTGMSRYVQAVYRSCDGAKAETFTYRESPLLIEEISKQLADLSRAGLTKISCTVNPVSDRFEYICTATR